MEYTCAISGIRVITNDSLSVPMKRLGAPIHPLFYAPPEALHTFGARIAANSLELHELHLVTLALLESTTLVEFRGAVLMNSQAVSQWGLRAFKLCTTLHAVHNLEHFPRIVFSPEAATFDTLGDILGVLEKSYEAHRLGTFGESRADDISRRQDALERLVRNPHKDPSSYAAALAAWAAVAGNFPTFTIIDPAKKSRSLSDYWQSLIVDCTRSKRISSLSAEDLKELETHCLENIPAGSLFSHRLFQILSNALIKLDAQWDFGDIDDIPPAPIKPFKIMNSLGEATSQSKELIQKEISATEPKREDYPDMVSFVMAKLRWKQANKL